MRRSSLLAVVISLFVVVGTVWAAPVGPVGDAAAQGGGPVAVVNVDNLNVREGPGTAFVILGVVHRGDRLPIVGRDANRLWWQVESPFGTGWVMARYIVVAGDVGGVEVTTDIQVSSYAQPIAVIFAPNLNVRTGPGLDYPVIGVVHTGMELIIVGRNTDWSWYQVSSPYGIGWVKASYVALRGDASGTPDVSPYVPPPPPPTPYAVVFTAYLNVRAGPGTEYAILGAVRSSTEMEIVGRNLDWSWYQVVSPFGVGWVRSRYVVLRGDASQVPIAAGEG